MKVLLLFRGHNHRKRTNWSFRDVETKGIDCLENWRVALFDDLKNNGIQYETTFITYPSPTLDALITECNPVDVITSGYESQMELMHRVGDYMVEKQSEYDRFVVMRFDFQYRIKITKWNKWHEQGITLVNKDRTWPTTHYYADIVFLVDSGNVHTFRDSLLGPHDPGPYGEPGNSWPHCVGQYLYNNNIPFNLMYDDYYDMTKHPLHALVAVEERPDFDRYWAGEPRPPA